MNDPGEFYSLITVGPYRGIPALFLVDTEDKVDEALLPDIVTKFSDVVGFGKGKSFIYLSREVNPLLVKTLREIGFYVVADVDVGGKAPWALEANHVMLGSTGVEYVGGPCDSFVLIHADEGPIKEPEFMPEVQAIGKFLYVPRISAEVFSFLEKSKYPWAVQVSDGFPFKVAIKL